MVFSGVVKCISLSFVSNARVTIPPQLISCITISCLWIGIRTNKFRNCLKRVLKDATAGVPSSFDK